MLDKAVAKDPSAPDLLYDLAMAAEKLERPDVHREEVARLVELSPISAHA